MRKKKTEEPMQTELDLDIDELMDKEKEEETPMTAIDALECIITMMVNSQMEQRDWELVKEECDYLKKQYGLSPFQCYMVAMMMDNDGETDMKSLAHHASCSQLRMYRYKTEAEALVDSRLARKEYRGRPFYVINSSLSNAIVMNCPYTPKTTAELTNQEVLDEVRGYIVDYQQCGHDNAREGILRNLRKLLAESAHLQMSAKIDELKLNDNDLLMLCVAAVHIMLMDEGNIGPMDWEDIWPDNEDNAELDALQDGSSALIKLDYLEPQHRNGQCIEGFFLLTDKALREIFGDFKKARKRRQVQVHTDHRIILPENIGMKQLFYNPAESDQVQRLGSLLSQEQFKGIQQRLKENGLRQGFACLFYGDPGTGKTETALQLARQTGRQIMKVDVTKLRDKYVGESEKAVQSLFDQYAALLNQEKEAPILLLNEADAILTRRMEGSVNAVDKMENAMQNIMLQALETFEGIVIATTNLTGSLDPAFERRFLYKIKFGKPSQEVKEKIWHAMLPDLGDDETRELAKAYDFSGGQIENIKRKQVVDYLLYGTSVAYDHIVQLCKEEKLTKKNAPTIGFGKS